MSDETSSHANVSPHDPVIHNATSSEYVEGGSTRADTIDGSYANPIQKSHLLLETTLFNPESVLSLRGEVRSHCESLIALRSSMEVSSTSAVAAPDQHGIEELEREIHHLQLKEAALTQYLRSNPFNNKNVLRPRRNLAEGTFLHITTLVSQMNERFNSLSDLIQAGSDLEEYKALEQGIPMLKDLFDVWRATEVKIYEVADPEHCSHPPDFYKNNKTEDNPISRYTDSYFAQKFQDFFRDVGIPKDFVELVTPQAIRVATAKVMNEIQPWEVATRDMTVALQGETRRFRQIATPLSASTTAVGKALLANGVHGVIPATRADGRAPVNTRMTVLLEMLDEKAENGMFQTEFLHERLQHGINDHFHLEEPERSAANLKSALQLIQYGIEADPEFVRYLFSKQEMGNTTPSNVFFINTNLTTPTRTLRDNPLSGEKGTHDEREYSEYQGRALQSASGEAKEFRLLDCGEEKAATLNVTCIDLRFPVNYAVDTVGALDPGMMLGTWNELHAHNSQEFQKLFGALEFNAPIEGVIGSTYEKLRELASSETISSAEASFLGGIPFFENHFSHNSETPGTGPLNENITYSDVTPSAGEDQPRSPALRAAMLRREIEDQCNAVRSLFNDKSYMRSDGDRMKMARHIDLLVNKFREATRLVDDLNTRVVNAGGCMSGKDREGVAHAEAVAAVMIERMKDTTLPAGYQFTPEEREIYDTAVSLVVDNTLLVTGYGGSKNAEEVADRIGNHDAIEYAAGLSKFAKT